MKYIPGKMHMLCTINTYANLTKIFKKENVLILFTSISFNAFLSFWSEVKSKTFPFSSAPTPDNEYVIQKQSYIFGFGQEEFVSSHWNLSLNKS